MGPFSNPGLATRAWALLWPFLLCDLEKVTQPQGLFPHPNGGDAVALGDGVAQPWLHIAVSCRESF